MDVESQRRAARDAAVLAAAHRRGIRTGTGTCIHVPARRDCAPCTEVALRLVLAEVEDVHAEYA